MSTEEQCAQALTVATSPLLCTWNVETDKLHTLGCLATVLSILRPHFVQVCFQGFPDSERAMTQSWTAHVKVVSSGVKAVSNG